METYSWKSPANGVDSFCRTLYLCLGFLVFQTEQLPILPNDIGRGLR